MSGGITLGDFSHSYECEENKKFSFIYNCSRNSKNYIIYIAICNLGVLECVHSLMNTESFSNAVLYFIILTIITDIYDDYTYIYICIFVHMCVSIFILVSSFFVHQCSEQFILFNNLPYLLKIRLIFLLVNY